MAQSERGLIVLSYIGHEAEVRTVLRDEFGLNMSDEEIRTCIDVMERKGEKGAPHPFFA